MIIDRSDDAPSPVSTSRTIPYAMCASAMLQIVFQILVEKLEVCLPAIHPVLISIDGSTS